MTLRSTVVATCDYYEQWPVYHSLSNLTSAASRWTLCSLIE